ncbi:MAG: hypothetical protein KBC41_01080 [Candidatus Pacebacteria bacterium]|nr:hypothetical protein [Candidatus Paceibacterota bacterium]MBP9866655.1 hypothetical protein [Candidatus Paceibacterota bacterium]
MPLQYKSSTLYEKTVHAMFGTLSVLALVYCFVLLSLVFSVIDRKQNTLANRDLVSQLSALEANYANQLSSINETVLEANEYTRIDSTTFAVRKDAIASYTVLYER